jgi:G:T-mismatch repair DNA endonuclease (very short patch repair protein)
MMMLGIATVRIEKKSAHRAADSIAKQFQPVLAVHGCYLHTLEREYQVLFRASWDVVIVEADLPVS